jgi:hypothetical protein
LIGLTNLRASPRPEPPKLDRARARFVLQRIDQILEWEKSVEHERDTRFVEHPAISESLNREIRQSVAVAEPRSSTSGRRVR